MTMADTVAVMRAGRIEQLGVPTELYDHPATAFVANFLGQSNLLPIQLGGETGGGLVEASSHDLRFQVASDQLGSDVRDGLQLGIRPEKLRLVAVGDTAVNRLSGVVSDASFTGVATTYLVRMPWDQEITLTRPNDGSPRARLGEAVTVAWEPEHAFVVGPG